MSRPIDADKIKAEDFYDCVNTEECMEVINRQPTIQQGIDPQRLIEELERVFKKFNISWNGCFGSAVQETVNQQPQTGWIPVSSGELPKRVKPVLVTAKVHELAEPYTSMDYITSEGDWKSYENEQITAWRPLPPAYEESE